ncbi:MAG TPA: M13 family metallopeptidase [Usitatibacter sp.]|nr:M13 family metallopeptidase [Usitatibacter sp.]
MKLPVLPRVLAAAFALACAPSALAALDVAGIDRSLDACTDFYAYANKSWLQATTIPADRARWGTFEIIDQRNEKVLVDALEAERKRQAIAKKYKRGTPEWMAVQYYMSGLNSNHINDHVYHPLMPLFDQARRVASAEDLARAIGVLHTKGIGAGFALSVDPDRKDSTRYLAGVFQGGLGLPDRDYYFLDDERSKKLREGYRRHVTRMFELLDDKPEVAARNAQTVIALETELARASMTATEKRDDTKTYNKMTVAELAAEAPGFPWPAYFEAVGAKNLPSLNVAQPAFMKAFAKLASERASDWPTYLRWHIIRASASKLPARFEDEWFDFYQRQFRGVQNAPPRHRRVLQTVGGTYGSEGAGFALGKIFTDETFPPEAKARALELVNNVKAALEDRLKAAEWMTEETRQRSLEKLRTMQVKIGYPDQWRDISDAKLGGQLYLENWLAANEFDHKREVTRIGQPVDKGEWLISPHIVNAYYNQSSNEIVFPAAILQPPYFDAKADDAVNYGGIGMVIGHEITHGFDDRGRRFDKDGNLRDWWTPEDERRYAERAQVIERQYGAMPGIEGVNPNGKLTLGENISDVGGLKIAYDALQKALKGKPRTPVQGLTPEQRFFLSFAQGWRSSARLEWERNSLLTGQHSLPRFRVAGPLAHMPEFARAFSCDASRTMLPDAARNAIW